MNYQTRALMAQRRWEYWQKRKRQDRIVRRFTYPIRFLRKLLTGGIMVLLMASFAHADDLEMYKAILESYKAPQSHQQEMEVIRRNLILNDNTRQVRDLEESINRQNQEIEKLRRILKR